MRWKAGLAVLLLLLAPALAVARPGGGEGYSGGGDGGGGGDGAGELVFFLLRLWIQFVIRYPVIGIPMTIAGILVFLAWKRKRGAAGSQNWDLVPQHVAPPQRPPSVDLDAIRQVDPEFSVVLFEDFTYALYARAHQARSDRRALDSLAPYLSPPAREHLLQRPPAGVPVTSVVVGATRVRNLVVPAQGNQTSAWVQVVLEIEANLTIGDPAGYRAQYVRERWSLVRGASVRSKPPELVKTFKCPNCGAPFDPAGAAAGDRCGFCGEVVSGGRFDWTVQGIDLLKVEARPPALTSSVQEAGTDFPTVLHPALAVRRAELLRDDPATTDEALTARLRLIYDQLNASWTALDLAPVRPHVSDGLFDYLQYWIDAYQRQGLRNVLEGMRMTESVIAKVVRDAHYDSVTFRIWGSGRDYTVRQADNQVMSGDPKRDRVYSEYWTLIRGAGVKGTPHADRNCPNCGASLDQVNMAGECGYCGAKITSGRFDWVLSKIEQDDSYTG